jgi:hypothetical protein
MDGVQKNATTDKNSTSLSIDTEVLCLLLVTSSSSFYFCQPWILCRKWTISHKTYTFDN